MSNQDDDVALGVMPYWMTDEEMAKLPSGIRGKMEQRRARKLEHLAAKMRARQSAVRTLNRESALKIGRIHEGTQLYFTQCACRWHGIETPDAEVARREYDAHACLINGDHAVDRAILEGPDRMLQKRDKDEMVVAPILVDLNKEAEEILELTKQALKSNEYATESELRFALLELK